MPPAVEHDKVTNPVDAEESSIRPTPAVRSAASHVSSNPCIFGDVYQAEAHVMSQRHLCTPLTRPLDLTAVRVHLVQDDEHIDIASGVVAPDPAQVRTSSKPRSIRHRTRWQLGHLRTEPEAQLYCRARAAAYGVRVSGSLHRPRDGHVIGSSTMMGAHGSPRRLFCKLAAHASTTRRPALGPRFF